MFLLQAKRMARGMARLRYILIMIARMLAVAGLIFAISRPMSGGWLGLTTSGAPELTVVILDRSVSMEEQDPVTNRSKRETAVEKLASVLRDLGRNTRIALFDSATGKRFDLNSPEALLELPEIAPTSTSADIPALMQEASEYILTNEAGRTDVWICSDLRQSDWNPSGGRWDSVREQLRNRDGVRLYLLAYQDLAPDNLAVSVSGVHRRDRRCQVDRQSGNDGRSTGSQWSHDSDRSRIQTWLGSSRTSARCELIRQCFDVCLCGTGCSKDCDRVRRY